MMGFVTAGPRIWPLPPDWAEGVREALAWSSDVLTSAATASSMHIGHTDTPRRRFTFDVLDQSREYRLAQMLLAGYNGVWLLPVWPDVQWLTATLAAGSDEIACRTEGFDFVEGGQALLYRDARTWEIVEIDGIDPGGLTFDGLTAAAFGPGDRLYPLRRARVQPGVQAEHITAQAFKSSLVFDIAEPCDWPALDSLPAYRGHPALTVRTDEGEPPTASYPRMQLQTDYGVALPFVRDMPGWAQRVQSHAWLLGGRDQHTWFRSLAYLLRGRSVPLWVPSWTDDLSLASDIGASSTTLSIDWTGYVQFGLGKPNRTDLCIELTDGTIYRRRITNAVEAGATETLTLDSALSGSAIARHHVRQVSFLSLCTLASDTVELEHVNDADGVANASTPWQAVVPDV